jgi:electron transport complex protein RnfE
MAEMIGSKGEMLRRAADGVGGGGGAAAAIPMPVAAAAAASAPAAPAEPSTGQLAVTQFLKQLWEENPTLRTLLGMCPTLAVTAACKPALTMGLAVTFVVVCSNMMISVMRKALAPHLRILMFTLTIAVFVTIADLFLRAFVPDMSEVLGPFVPLIIVNCIIIARAESCAAKSGLLISTLDGFGAGFGHTLALLMLATVREILGNGTWFEVRVLPSWWVPWTVMKLPAGAFITLGFTLGTIIHLHARRRRRG